MNYEKVRAYQGVAVIVALLAVSWAVLSGVGAYTSAIAPAAFRSFSVSADGKAVGVPDVAKFTFSVLTEGGKDLAMLQTQNTTKVNAAIAYLKSKDIDAKDIQTSQYSVNPRYQYYNCSSRPVDTAGTVTPCPPPDIVGYSVNQSVSVKVRDFTVVGDVLSGVVTAGANSVSELQFTVDDPTSLQDEARSEAIDKAKTKAKAIADAGGFSLGRLLSIEEGGGVMPYPMYAKTDSVAYGMGGAAVPPAPVVEPGSQDTMVTVTLRYEIK